MQEVEIRRIVVPGQPWWGEFARHHLNRENAGCGAVILEKAGSTKLAKSKTLSPK
jgi:hypothetical protein